jgi:hypothetical protein
MCWNAEVSLNTFIFSLFGAVFAYFNNVIDIYSLLYFISFISIQLVEYFTWNNINDKKINRLLSQIALFLIIIQIPFFIYSLKTVPNKFSLVSLYLLLWLIVICYYNIDFSMNKASNGHLEWNWLKIPLWIIFIYQSIMIALFFYEEKYIYGVLYFIIVCGIYYTYHKSNTWGSLWCWIANALSILLIIQVFSKKLC